MVGVRPLRRGRRRDADAEAAVGAPSRVIEADAVGADRELRGPQGPDHPRGRASEHRAHPRPVDEVGRAQQREARRVGGGGRRRPECTRRPRHRGVGKVPRHHRISPGDRGRGRGGHLLRSGREGAGAGQQDEQEERETDGCACQVSATARTDVRCGPRRPARPRTPPPAPRAAPTPPRPCRAGSSPARRPPPSARSGAVPRPSVRRNPTSPARYSAVPAPSASASANASACPGSASACFSPAAIATIPSSRSRCQ